MDIVLSATFLIKECTTTYCGSVGKDSLGRVFLSRLPANLKHLSLRAEILRDTIPGNHNHSHPIISVLYSNQILLDFDLRHSSELRVLDVHLTFPQEWVPSLLRFEVIRWFKHVCLSITSPQLRIQLYGLPIDMQRCREIEDVLIALDERVGGLSVYLERRAMFQRLCDRGVVVDQEDTYICRAWAAR